MIAQPERSRDRKLIYAIALFAIVVSGFLLRVWNLNFDQGLMTHPDERSTVCFIAPSIHWPRSFEEFGDPDRSPLNPMWNRVEQRATNYTYGHFPLYMGVLNGRLLHALAPLAENMGVPAGTVTLMARADQPCAGVAIAGRLLIALLDTWTVLLVYFLGRRIFGAGVGLIAAAFYAFAAQAVQLAHFFAMDPASTTFTVLAVLGGVKMVQERTLGAAALSGLGAGLAVASKFSALPVLAVPVTAVVLWIATAQRETPQDVTRSQARGLGALFVAFVVMGATFFLASPYAVLDWDRFVKATLVDQGQMVRGVADFPFTRQYRNTVPYVYFIQQQVQWGLGWPLGVLSLAGTLLAALALVWTFAKLAAAWARGQLGELALSRVEVANVVVWSWVAPYFGITGAFLAKFNRYMSPVLPFAVLFGAGAFWVLWRWAQSRRASRLMMAATGVLATVIVVCAALWSLAYVNGIHNREHTWITASRWIYQNVPSDSVILWELWDDPLPKTVPNEAGMDMVSTGLRNIDWSPYEEDTAEKYVVLKQRLSEADFVVYSSKRIYDSVDELPRRYPMTNLYYDAMWDGRLGFDLAAEFTAPPRLLGWTFDDRDADESWSLYDHPQVTVFRKTRQLSDAEFDALFNRAWERAIHHDRGPDSPLSPVLQLLGLGSQPGSERQGIIGALVGMLSGNAQSAPVSSHNEPDLLFDEPLANLAVVDNYRWNRWASEQPLVAVLVWWLVMSLLGWLAWPLCFGLFAPWLDRGYLFSRTVGWLLAGWLLWVFASAGILYNSVVNSWIMVAFLAIAGAVIAWQQRTTMRKFLADRWMLLVAEEALFGAAFAFFIFIRVVNPDLWQPWLGGEKFMEFAFLNGVLRSPTFPPVDPHFAGGYINYYYFGIYLVGYLIKLTGIYAEVAFNLTIPLLFALTIANSFAITHTAWAIWRRTQAWQQGMPAALLGPFFVALLGNLDGYGQIVRQLSERSPVQLQSALPGVTWLVEGVVGLVQIATGKTTLPPYDFWAPSRVLPATINEFPYWSFLFADLHPHLIGIPLSLLFLGALFNLVLQYAGGWERRGVGLALVGSLIFLLGALSSVNLWELPTYLGLAILTLLLCEYRYFGRFHLGRVLVASFVLLFGAMLLYFPFFTKFVNVGASGIGFVHQGDDLGLWLLLWGGLGFMMLSWLLWRAHRAGLPQEMRARRTALEVSPTFQDVTPERAEGTHDPVADPAPSEHVTIVETNENALYAEGVSPSEPESAAQEGIEEATDGGWREPSAATLNALSESNVPEPRSGVARLVGMTMRHFDRLPRLWYLHRMLVRQPALSYLLGVATIPALFLLAVAAWLLDRSVLALCLAVLAFGLPLLWRREREADSADHLATILAVTGLAILAGTQVVYLKDFLQGGEYYRMNTLFKFFNQVWVLWAVAAAIALPRLWRAAWQRPMDEAAHDSEQNELLDTSSAEDMEEVPERNWQPVPRSPGFGRRGWGLLWRLACVLIVLACSVYIVFGTPARLSQRFVGWVPPLGTLNGMAFMEQGRYAWPNDAHWIDLSHDYQAIQWLLENVRGNLVIAESAEVDYYRAGGTRVASMTGLSGLRGAHVSEQRSGEQVGARDGLHREFWSTMSLERTEELIAQLQISLIYAGQLERYVHPEGVQKLANMASEGRLDVLYENAGVIIYAVPNTLAVSGGGWLVPVPQSSPLQVPSMGAHPPMTSPSNEPS